MLLSTNEFFSRHVGGRGHQGRRRGAVVLNYPQMLLRNQQPMCADPGAR
jgi:hypothetical protein